MSDRTRIHTAVLSTGAPVLRQGMRPDGSFGTWSERLAVEGADLSRMPGAPVLLDHLARTAAQVGVVEDARIERGQIQASVRFGEGALAREIERDVRDRIRQQLSVGYHVEEWQSAGKAGDVPAFTAVRWTPLECSVVAIGADPSARFRSDGEGLCYRALDLPAAPSTDFPEAGPTEAPATSRHPLQGAWNMLRSFGRLGGGTPAALSAEPEAPTSTPDPLAIERTRCREIVEICRTAGFPQEAERFIESGTGIDQVRAEMWRAWAGRYPESERIQGQHLGGTVDRAQAQRQDVGRGISEYLAFRLSNGASDLTPAGQAFRGSTLLDCGRLLAEAAGVRVGNQHEVVDFMLAGQRGYLGRGLGGMMTTSDFPLLMADSANRALLDRFRLLQPALARVARRTEVSDFRPVTRIRLGEGSALLPVEEHGEIQAGTVGERGESYTVRSYGRKFGLTRKVIVNDDLGALQDFINNVAAISATTLGDALWNAINNNAAMSDGTPVFHANHGNLGAAGAPTIANLGLARQSMRQQIGIDGARISVSPRFLVVGPALETVAEQLLATLAAGTVADVNPFAGRLELVVEDRIPDARWYLFADPALAPVLEWAELDGSRPMGGSGPRVETFTSVDVDGIAIRVLYDVGAGIVSYQGAYRNPG